MRILLQAGFISALVLSLPVVTQCFVNFIKKQVATKASKREFLVMHFSKRLDLFGDEVFASLNARLVVNL